jgi:glycosyltransferase involved in cell wall biosynthesis
VRRLSLAWVVVLRPIKAEEKSPSLSIIIPTRNEKGNIEELLLRLPALDANSEVIFVEGHSTDGTWEEIQRVAAIHSEKYKIHTLRQTGEGKADAVRLGIARATGDLITILDADLTMPPEMLGRFYDAWREGRADFINGNRLMYPMEDRAMRFLNRLGNVFFAKALSFVLDTPIGDSLCGTKLFSRRDYERFTKWRETFGDVDPFGDFELLFPACALGVGLIEVPIRYRSRRYGTTNIHRFYHGWILLRMTILGFLRLRCGVSSPPEDGH